MMTRLTFLSVVTVLITCSGCSSTLSNGANQPEAEVYHADEHTHTPHVGIMVPFFAVGTEKQQGFAELKLHDDKGDLELWLTRDSSGILPFDLSLDSVITVAFADLNNKQVSLKVRNSHTNEDEDGKGNIRNNKTQYFIFPGDSGADASFLVGKGFVATVTISFSSNGVSYITKPFELSPHTH